MTIFAKALQFALEAMQEEEVELADAIIKQIDLAEIGAGSADQESLSYLIKTFIDLDLFSAAAKTAIYALHHSITPSSDLRDLLQYELSRRGLWAEHNEISMLIADVASNEQLERMTQHLLNQLEIKKASKLIAILEQRRGATLSIETIALLIASREYQQVELHFANNEGLLDALMDHNGLRHWLYLFLSYSDDLWVTKAAATLAKKTHFTLAVLDNYAHFMKVCWANGKADVCAQLISNIPTNLAPHLLSQHLIFCRVYAFSCQKLAVSNDLMKNLYREEFDVFSRPEIWTLNLKKETLERGVVGPLQEAFGPISTSRGAKPKAILPLILYGKDYIREAKDLFVESALAAEDFLNLAKRFEFSIRICTDHDSCSEIEDVFSPLAEHGFIIDLQRAVFPKEELPHKRMWFYVDAMLAAELNEGVFFCMCPDAVFGDGLAELIERCPQGGGAGGGLMRASWSAMRRSVGNGRLASILKNPDKNRELVTHAITNWSHYSHRLFFENISDNYVSKVENGIRYNSWQGVPHVIKPDKGFTQKLINRAVYRYSNVFGDHLGQDLDHDMIGVLNEEGRLYMLDSYEDFVFIEVAHDAGYSQLWKFQLPMGHKLPTPVGETYLFHSAV